MHTFLLPPVVAVLTIILMALLDRYLPLARLWETHVCWIGVPLIVLGLGIAKWHANLFRKRGTNIKTFAEPGALITEGLFRISRNPMYLGLVLALAGVSTLLGSMAPFLALLGFVLLTNYWYIPFEEKAMLEKFGAQYASYRRKVRRWL